MITESVLFAFREMRASLVRPCEDTLLNAARYQLRVAMCRVDTRKTTNRIGISEFAMILAHVRDTINFPFEIPDPLSNPYDVGEAWDHFVDGDTELWNRLARGIAAPINAASQYLPVALEEIQALVRHGMMPPPSKR
jgi:hypothetical protein